MLNKLLNSMSKPGVENIKFWWDQLVVTSGLNYDAKNAFSNDNRYSINHYYFHISRVRVRVVISV